MKKCPQESKTLKFGRGSWKVLCLPSNIQNQNSEVSKEGNKSFVKFAINKEKDDPLGDELLFNIHTAESFPVG